MQENQVRFNEEWRYEMERVLTSTSILLQKKYKYGSVYPMSLPMEIRELFGSRRDDLLKFEMKIMKIRK